MSTVGDDFYRAVLAGINAPADAANLFTCHAWQEMEGGTADYNPWNTTEPMPGARNYNSVGVKEYRNEADGIRATIATLTNGRYAPILAGFRSSDPQRTADAIDHSPWGTHGVGALVRRTWKGEEDMALPDADKAWIKETVDHAVNASWAAEISAPTDAPSYDANKKWQRQSFLGNIAFNMYETLGLVKRIARKLGA